MHVTYFSAKIPYYIQTKLPTLSATVRAHITTNVSAVFLFDYCVNGTVVA